MAIFGNNVHDGSRTDGNDDRVYVNQWTVSGGDVAITTLRAYCYAAGAFRLVLYASDGSGGGPGTRLCYTADLTASGSGFAEYGAAPNTPTTLVDGVSYWIGIHFGSAVGIAFNSSVLRDRDWRTSATFASGAPNPFGSFITTSYATLAIWAVVSAPSVHTATAAVNAAGAVTAVGSIQRLLTRTAAVNATATVAARGAPVLTFTRTATITAAGAISVAGLVPGVITPGTTLWSFTLTDIGTGSELVDLTPAVLTAKIAPRLNRPLSVTLELPADNPDIRATAYDGDPNLTVGTRCIKAYRNGVLRANVIVWNLSYDGDANGARVSVTGHDPMVQLRRRPARDATGDFSNPEFGDSTEAGELVKYIVDNTITWEGELLIDTEEGTCDASTALGGNLGGWPIMVFDLLTIITDTGVVDVVLEPTESIPDKLAVLNAVDTWGEDRTATVSFDYATGDRNVASCRRVVDFDEICNKLWIYLGPKIDIQHWRGNITGRDDPSIAKYGVYMDIHIYDSGDENIYRNLFTQLWANELALRKIPAELLYVTPQAGRGPEPFDDYGIGDLVTVNLGTVFGPAVSGGVQRIYGYDCDIDSDGVERVSELIVSAQGE